MLEEKSYLTHKYGFSNVEILQDEKGPYRIVCMRDYWDIPALRGNQPETYGFPTQKPIELYERMILASTETGNTVLDPFCGCATTPIACEIQGRNWVGIDIWDQAHKAVVDRIDKYRSFVPHINYTTDIPIRSDFGEIAAPHLRVKVRVQEPPGPRMSRDEMYDYLLEQDGSRCQGCYRQFDDPRYLELDHNTPRSDGGVNHISNRILLCGPCNKLKSNTYTLSGLRNQNKKLGYMAG